MSQSGGPIRFRLVVHEPADGFWNMAVDEVLLNSVSKGGRPVVRLYGFCPATLSVGRFQHAKEDLYMDAIRNQGIPFVRRPTAGRAVFHADELTYSVAVGKNHIEHFSKRSVYRLVIPVLLQGLANLGVRGAVNVEQKGSPLNPDCFASSGEYEISSHTGKKLVGSAQMVLRTGVLQHGSIPLNSEGRRIVSYLRTIEGNPEHASSIREELGREVSFSEAIAAFSQGVQEILRAELCDLSAEEREEAKKLAELKYKGDEWNLVY